jgi:hypothetical protein
VVCGFSGGTQLDVVFPAVAGLSFGTNLGTGVVINTGTAAAPAWSPAIAVSAVGAPASSCGGSTLGSGAERRTLTITLPSSAATPAVGNVVYLYDQVTYRSGTSAAVPGRWIQRRVGEGSGAANQPMAGPIREDGNGLVFQYFAGAATTPLPTPINDAVTRESVSRVVLVVESVSRKRFGSSPESKADTVVISLRNRT